jgi:hypothetical protein
MEGQQLRLIFETPDLAESCFAQRREQIPVARSHVEDRGLARQCIETEQRKPGAIGCLWIAQQVLANAGIAFAPTRGFVSAVPMLADASW